MATLNLLSTHPVHQGSSALDAISIDGDSASDLGDDTAGPDGSEAVLFADEDHQRDIKKLLNLPDIYYPPELRKQTPMQMADSCTLMEHQKICLTWLLNQEEDKHKKGGLLAGM